MQTDPASIFVTATDTGVGKTVWTSALLYWARKRGLPTLPCKPVQSGCREDNGTLVATDLEFALSTAGIQLTNEDRQALSPLRLREACSPHLAAERMGIVQNVQAWINALITLLHAKEHLLVEGAGGVHVPVHRNYTILDLMQDLGVPIFLVARSDLGTLNHTMLTLESLHARNLRVLGIACSPPSPETPTWMVEDNLRTLHDLSGLPVWGPLDFIPKLDTQQPPPADWPSSSEPLFNQIFTDIRWI